MPISVFKDSKYPTSNIEILHCFQLVRTALLSAHLKPDTASFPESVASVRMRPWRTYGVSQECEKLNPTEAMQPPLLAEERERVCVRMSPVRRVIQNEVTAKTNTANNEANTETNFRKVTLMTVWRVSE